MGPMSQKVEIQGASSFAKRFFSECGQFQWARELLQNSVEAKATKIEFGIEWQAVVQHQIYRRIIADNGIGMTPDELVKFFRTLGLSSKNTDGLENNYGIGAKIASLPWNPLGVTVISFTNRGSKSTAAMIRIFLDENGDFCLHEFIDNDKGIVSCINPEEVDWSQYDWTEYNPDWAVDNIDWSKVVPDWVKESGHGTVVVLHGSKEFPHTMMGSNAKDITKGLSIYLNTRFWEFAGIEQIKVAELKGEKREGKWPLGPDDKDTKRSPNNRTIMGARYYIEEPKDGGKIVHSGTIQLKDDKVKLHWYLWEGERPEYGAYAEKNGYIGIRYLNELYNTDSGKIRFRYFGIIESKVKDRLTILLEPVRAKKARDWGVSPNQARSRLDYCDGEAGALELPWLEWGEEFYKKMPEPIKKAIAEARGEGQGEFNDEEYRKRLQDLFGSRWRVKVDVVAPGPGVVRRGELTPVTGGNQQGQGTGGGGSSSGPQREATATGQNSGQGVQQTALQAVSIPVYHFKEKEEFSKPWHLAFWSPAENAVYINTGSEILRNLENYHVERYPQAHEEDVRMEIRRAFGEIAVAKIAHSQQLKHLINVSVIDEKYRTEEALTIALMGYISEDKYIALKLRKFGRAEDRDQPN